MASCGLPPGSSRTKSQDAFGDSLARRGYNGPLIINAYGDSRRISPAIIDCITATGIAFHHVPGGERLYRFLHPSALREPPENWGIPYV